MRAIYEDEDGVLWIGTYDGGLNRYKGDKFTSYTMKEGMFSNGVFAILEGVRGNFWMSSNQSIYRVSRRQLNDFAEGKISKVHFSGIDDFCQYFEPSFKSRLLQSATLQRHRKKNMKNRLLSVFDQIMLRKRALIETINDQLKNICQIEHTRHRSRTNFLVNVIAALIAYTFKEKKPSLNIRVKELEQLPAFV